VPFFPSAPRGRSGRGQPQPSKVRRIIWLTCPSVIRTLDEWPGQRLLTTRKYVYIPLIMREPTEHDRIEHLARTCAGINLRRASRAVSNYYDSVLLAACGLRATQIPTLVALYLAGPLTIHEIAVKLGLDRTTLTRNLRLLEKGGLIKMEPGQDQRTRVAALTKHGKSALLKALPVWEEAQAHVVNGLGEARFRALLTQLSDVAELTREEGHPD